MYTHISSTLVFVLVSCLLTRVYSQSGSSIATGSASSSGVSSSIPNGNVAGGTNGGGYSIGSGIDSRGVYGGAGSSTFAGTGGFAGAGAFAGASAGGGVPAVAYAGPGFHSSYGFNSFPFGVSNPDMIFQRIRAQMMANAQMHAIAQEEAYRNAVNQGAYGPNTVGASAFGSIGPQGGYGHSEIYPKPETRIGGASYDNGPVGSAGGVLPPSNGQFYGVSTHTSSISNNVNGKETNYRTSSVTLNDNGNVKTYTSHYP